MTLDNVKITDVEAAPVARAGRGSESALTAARDGFREGMRARERGDGTLDSTQLGEFLRRRPAPGARGVGAWFKHTVKGRLLEITRLPVEQRDRMLRDAFVSRLGNVAICLVPVFALLLRGLWFRARLYYAEHFVVALHTHAFAFGALTLILLLAEGKHAVAGLPAGALRSALRDGLGLVILGLAAWLPVYPFLALRRVYGGSRAATLAKYVVLGGLYSLALLAGATVAVFAAILFG